MGTESRSVLKNKYIEESRLGVTGGWEVGDWTTAGGGRVSLENDKKMFLKKMSKWRRPQSPVDTLKSTISCALNGQNGMIM